MMIAGLFIMLTYSAAIPILYLAGCAQMIIMYWADKTLFLRHYRLPRRYGRKLAGRVVEVMQWAILLHLLFGLYMLSNPEIFTYENKDLSKVEWAKNYMDFFSSGFNKLFGTDQTRFAQVHTVIYFIGIVLFVVLFFVERCSGVFSRLIGACCGLFDQEGATQFSSNIFEELSPEDQRHEYAATNTSIKHVEYRIFKQDAGNPALYEYYLQRLKLKQLEMRAKVAEKLAKKGAKMREVMRDTKMGFQNLEKTQGADYRMVGLYSYNLLDHPDFIRAQRIEKRIVRYNRRQLAHR